VHERERTAEEERAPAGGGAISQRETIQGAADERRRKRAGTGKKLGRRKRIKGREVDE